MATSYSERDISLIPNITFSFVESYIKSTKRSSGDKSINKGYKYFSEGYIQDLKVIPVGNGSRVTGKCFRSQRKNEKPHQLSVNFEVRCTDTPSITIASCTCVIGLSGACGHVVGTLYQLANYMNLGLKALPEDIARTSQPQTWHTPREEKIHGKAVQDLDISGYSRSGTTSSRCSTLYYPVRDEGVNWKDHVEKLESLDKKLLIIPALKQSVPETIDTRFGKVAKGSVLSYQLKMESDCVINIYDGISFPQMPVENVMVNELNIVLSTKQCAEFETIKLTLNEVNKFEKSTRLQSKSPLWFKLRKNRLTASKFGEIYKRKKNNTTLVDRLKSTKTVTTAAMKAGIAAEPLAAAAYVLAQDNQVNLYPCGVVISHWAPWIAASPDRKVYKPSMLPPFGILEIKCPQNTSVLECKYLMKYGDELRLKRDHLYYFQILTQLAVTGLDWCDFFVWCQHDHHLETIYFNTELWQNVKNKVDLFYFDSYL